MAGPRVAGVFGARPTITFPAGPPPAGVHVTEPATGEGAPLEPGGVAVVQYTAHLWDGRENRLLASTFNRGTPTAFPLGALPPGLDTALEGRRAGSRVTAAIPLRAGSSGDGHVRSSTPYHPASGTLSETAASGPASGTGPGSMGVSPASGSASGAADLFYVIDILGAHPAGAVVEAGAGAVAGVRVGGGAVPALEIPEGEPPERMAVAVLARGAGPPAGTGRLLVVQYAGATWSDRRVFTSTWERGRPEAVTIGDGSVIAGWNRALADVSAGSRVAMVVPPGDAYGDTGTDAVPPGETLVFVVDVLAAY
ncbi:FKBP-type peptidyl-prolyl cis-trans isomerase [Nonomuraea sp. NPDC048826]|uniref:FKBP-type peptidyl-prolyl cis-trans isomerase n=1 Tax=Nonomuraea sp. NPDC048826 TaxID=3364347 RepID=UPI00370F9131